jgi:hypothetical protein
MRQFRSALLHMELISFSLLWRAAVPEKSGTRGSPSAMPRVRRAAACGGLYRNRRAARPRRFRSAPRYAVHQEER